jgi:signal peptidase II
VTAIVVGLLLVPLADQSVKAWMRGALGGGSVSLGPLGSLRIVHGRIWLARVLPARASRSVMWSLWLVAAAALSALALEIGSGAAFAGLLLGGSLSHLLESTVRGSIDDYVCLRFWPAFDLADAALVAGAIGLCMAAANVVPELS